MSNTLELQDVDTTVIREVANRLKNKYPEIQDGNRSELLEALESVSYDEIHHTLYEIIKENQKPIKSVVFECKIPLIFILVLAYVIKYLIGK
jgi:hypothetical protein